MSKIDMQLCNYVKIFIILSNTVLKYTLTLLQIFFSNNGQRSSRRTMRLLFHVVKARIAYIDYCLLKKFAKRKIFESLYLSNLNEKMHISKYQFMRIFFFY